uniref:AlNc14C346G10861 protein n=1 Tax=Albugo laibachii Nc14 TaxID=890382 RepID=F0WXA8_9STRA|nr:AlNc14C346G10861 [Albugo laibachii Nc14]|eukprot:CCA26100.1 AlNc14C346G10861 [Albugo laibachii Nc14]
MSLISLQQWMLGGIMAMVVQAHMVQLSQLKVDGNYMVTQQQAKGVDDEKFRRKGIIPRSGVWISRVGKACFGSVGAWFLLAQDVKVDLLRHYLDNMAEKFCNKQIEAWWVQNPTVQYAME